MELNEGHRIVNVLSIYLELQDCFSFSFGKEFTWTVFKDFPGNQFDGYLYGYSTSNCSASHPVVSALEIKHYITAKLTAP